MNSMKTNPPTLPVCKFLLLDAVRYKNEPRLVVGIGYKEGHGIRYDLGTTPVLPAKETDVAETAVSAVR